jgi:hypothetical protein
MMRSKLFAFAALALSVAVTTSLVPAHAQDDQRARGDKACNGDAKKLCSKFFGQGDMVILQCFQTNKTRLSASCKKFLTEVGQLN